MLKIFAFQIKVTSKSFGWSLDSTFLASTCNSNINSCIVYAYDPVLLD